MYRIFCRRCSEPRKRRPSSVCITTMALTPLFQNSALAKSLVYFACSLVWLDLGCARFASKFFSLISEIKRIWIRFTCVSLFHYKISLLFFRFFSLIFASYFSLRFTLVIFASKRNKDNLEEGYKNAYHGSKNPEIRT
jgi:hypothetical protein